VHGRPRLFAMLTTLEATLGAVVVVAGTVTVGSFLRTVSTDLGYEPSGVYLVGVRPDLGSSVARLSEVLTEIPSVLDVGQVDFPWGSSDAPNVLKPSAGPQVSMRQIGGAYLSVYQAKLLAGSDFPTGDSGAASTLAIVSASSTQIWMPGQPPASLVGRSIDLPGLGSRTVVGIVADTRQRHALPVTPEVLLPLDTAALSGAQIVVRVDETAVTSANDLRRQIEARLGAPVAAVAPIERTIDTWLQSPRLYAVILGLFGLVSVLLICVGIASVCAFDLASRRREISLRVALGGSPGSVGALIAIKSLTPLAIGLLSGSVLAHWSSAVLGSIAPGIEHMTVGGYLAVVCIFAAVGILAVSSPISRAIRNAPITALKDS
jgi:hypothetical protein